MRKVSNLVVGLLAAGVCILITYLTLDASRFNIFFNLGFLVVMVMIILGGLLFGFHRMGQTRRGLDRASDRLQNLASSGGAMSAITSQGSTLFAVPYLDEKYQEYLRYLHKTNSPTDIGDYIGEYEINNYTHRRTIEMVPDILTSLGILGTFVGLVWGLRGFNPTSYEAMSSSVEALIDGIKVAFVTSIYGLSLSLAFQYWLRGALTSVSESLDRFLDTYYTCAVPPTDATAMNHVIANQNTQTKLMQQMQKDLSEQVAQSLSNNISPMIEHLDHTMDDFSQTVTLNQERLLENIAERIARTMKQEFFSEFIEMRKVLGETNQSQREHLKFMQESEAKYQADVLDGEQRMTEAMEASSDVVVRALSAMNEQEQKLAQFVSDMQAAMNDIARTSDLNLRMTQQMDHLSEMNGEIAGKMMELSEANERYTRSLALVQADNDDLAEGLSVMNDANIRMTDQISKMNDLTVTALQDAQISQKEYVHTVSSYLEQLQTSQSTLAEEQKLQQEHLREFTDYMTQVLARMKQLTDSTQLSLKEVTDRLQELSTKREKEEREQTNQQLQMLVRLMEEQAQRDIARDEAAKEPPKRRGLFG